MAASSTNRSMALLGLVPLALTAAAAHVPRQHDALSIQVPSVLPQDVSDKVDPDFLGLAFEEASWTRYAMNDDGELNQFSANLISDIYKRTGGKPIIRLGGTSPDYGWYIPEQSEPALPVAEQDNYQCIGCTTISPSYWQSAKLFPDAKYMVQVPLANTNISEAVSWVQAAVEGIGLDQIHSIQIGNEPDHYKDDFRGEDDVFLGPPHFQGTLDNETYVGNYTKYAAVIREAVHLPDHFFTAFDVAANVADPSVGQWLLSPEACFGLGIDQDNIIKEVAHHYYQNHAGQAGDLEQGLMNISVTHRNLDYLLPRINWLKNNRPEIPFIINEIGNSLEATNSYEYQARLGSALWAIDFYLYNLANGVKRFNYQQIMHSGYDLWLPVASGGWDAQVFSNYYSQPFLADFIGDSGEARVSKLNINGGEQYPNLAAYAAYEEDETKRMAIANLDYWNRTSSETERRSARLYIGTEAECVKVTHISSPDGAGAGADTITYAGSQWTFESLGKEVKGVRDDTETIQTEAGFAYVEVPSSEAVIVYLQSTCNTA